MPLITISITPKQKRALHRRITRAGRGSLPHEISKAINQYVAGPRQVEAAFIKLLMQKAPKNLNAPSSCEGNRKKDRPGSGLAQEATDARRHSEHLSKGFAEEKTSYVWAIEKGCGWGGASEGTVEGQPTV
jgi:hypothetical protein